MPAERRRRVEPWAVAVPALLGFMIASSVAFYGVARRHPDPTVVDDAYGVGLRYSERLRDEQRARDLGWRLDLETELVGGGAMVRVLATDRDGAPLDADRVWLRRERPAEGGWDATWDVGGGDAAPLFVPLPRPGRWHFVVGAERGDVRLHRTFALRTGARP